MTENKVSYYYSEGDLIKATFVLDKSFYGIIIRKAKRRKGYGGQNSKDVITYHLVTPQGIVVINDLDWRIERV